MYLGKYQIWLSFWDIFCVNRKLRTILFSISLRFFIDSGNKKHEVCGFHMIENGSFDYGFMLNICWYVFD